MGAEISLPSKDELLELPLPELYNLLVNSVELDEFENVKILMDLERALDVNYMRGHLLNAASNKGFTEILDFLLTQKNGNIDLINPYNAAGNGYLDIIKILVRNGLNLTLPRYEHILTEAVLGGQLNVIHYLLENGINPNGDQGKPLQTAIEMKDQSAIELLYHFGAQKYIGQKTIRQLMSKFKSRQPSRAAYID
ncbi:MAG: ankyrin repeat domain-containing protein [Sphingobacteriaceae bacterium]|nr:MAG: ankyrin repeat domain-containing protein [Sphingobacteriaceae bacterium]